MCPNCHCYGVTKVLESREREDGSVTTIRAAIARKPKGHDFDYSRRQVSGQVLRHMSHTGG